MYCNLKYLLASILTYRPKYVDTTMAIWERLSLTALLVETSGLKETNCSFTHNGLFFSYMADDINGKSGDKKSRNKFIN